jgi:hypothetical protein
MKTIMAQSPELPEIRGYLEPIADENAEYTYETLHRIAVSDEPRTRSPSFKTPWILALLRIDNKDHHHALLTWMSEHRPLWRIEGKTRPEGAKGVTPREKRWGPDSPLSTLTEREGAQAMVHVGVRRDHCLGRIGLDQAGLFPDGQMLRERHQGPGLFDRGLGITGSIV